MKNITYNYFVLYNDGAVSIPYDDKATARTLSRLTMQNETRYPVALVRARVFSQMERVLRSVFAEIDGVTFQTA